MIMPIEEMPEFGFENEIDGFSQEMSSGIMQKNISEKGDFRKKKNLNKFSDKNIKHTKQISKDSNKDNFDDILSNDRINEIIDGISLEDEDENISGLDFESSKENTEKLVKRKHFKKISPNYENEQEILVHDEDEVIPGVRSVQRVDSRASQNSKNDRN